MIPDFGKAGEREIKDGVAQTGDCPLCSDKLQIVRASNFVRNFHGASK